ncbi:MAG: alpha/beta hydrolase [Bacteroidota bacterium]
MKKITSIFLSLFFAVNVLSAQEIIHLYQGTIPGNKNVPDNESSVTEGGILRISNITKPTLAIFLPAQPNGTAVVICPGGGYGINAMGHEGIEIARKFNEMGITAFVLKYRLPKDAAQEDKTIAPLQDAQQAIKVVRDNAVKWKINPNRIGIMGFSAGGHLASTAGTHFQKSFIENLNNTNLRPDFMLLIYPVISFVDTVGHMGSRDNLVGKNASPETIKLFSNEQQVSSGTPPAFLVHAADDKAVPSENSIRFYQALIKNKVPAELHIYQGGGHGFGLKNPTTKELWMDRCANWMAANGW